MFGPPPRMHRETVGASRSTVLGVSLITSLALAAGPVLGRGTPAHAASLPGPIVFASNRGGQSDLWVMHAYGSSPVNLTNDAARDDCPALSADGRRIAWTKGGLGPEGEIWVMEADGSNAHQVTFNAFPELNATWSQGGSRIAFRSLRGDNCDIYVIDADGRNERRLAPDPLKGGLPGWSPEGNRTLLSDTLCARNGASLTPALNPGDSAAWSRIGGGVASIEYNLPRAGHVHVRVYDAAGREVAHPVNEWQPAGHHVTMFAFGPAPNQVFRYHVQCGDRISSGKIATGP